MEHNQDNRVSLFPRTSTSYSSVLKRAATEDSSTGDKKRNGNKFHKITTGYTDLLNKRTGDPWQHYQKIYRSDQGGRGFVVHTKDNTFSDFFAKEVKVHTKEWLSRITLASHKNIVFLKETLYSNGALYFFYELMDVSLAQVFATPFGRLKAYEVAAFCHEILNGLEYIHQTLRFTHGNLTSGNVLLSMDGAVKIGMSPHDQDR
jgi:Serine/threonine protein kinase